MTIPRSHGRSRGRVWAGSLLLATIAAGSAAVGSAAVAAPLSPAGPAHAAGQLAVAGGNGGVQQQVSWSILPATSAGPDRTRVIFSYGTVQPGSTIHDHVEIVNRSKQGAAFSVYATDATGTTLNNALTLLPVNGKPVDVGAWTTFPSGAAQLSTVIPGGKAIIEQFTISVPRQATPGDHTGGMIAQVAIPHKNSKGQVIEQYQRIAVPIELRVPGALRAGLAVQSISTGFSDPVNPFGNGSATISYSIVNTGNVRQTGTQVVTVTGPFGQAQTVHPAQLPTILPGDSVRVSVAVPGLYPAGPMSAKVTVTPGWPPRTPPLSQSAPVTTGTASLFAMPWSVVGLILLLVAIGFGLRRYLAWRRQEHQAEVAAAAAKARRETERRLTSTRSAATAATSPARAAKSAAAAASPAPTAGGDGTEVAPSVAPDSGSAPE